MMVSEHFARLVAHYYEEHTSALFQIENCDTASFFDFREHANTDQVSGRHLEPQRFLRD